jgi:hypothetical protein
MSAANYGDIIEVTAPADFHVHLRDGELSKLVTPHVHKGGFYLAYVMVRVNHLSSWDNGQFNDHSQISCPQLPLQRWQSNTRKG